MNFEFLDWYNHTYCREVFDSDDDYESHKKIAYSGWIAAMKVYGVSLIK